MGGDFRKPGPADLAALGRYERAGGRYLIRFRSPEAHFREILARPDPRIPEERADFNPLMQGVNSSRIRLKQAHRRLESLAFALDILTLAHPSAAARRDSDALWETISWNAFHDIICGTLEDRAYREALRRNKVAERRAEAALQRAAVRCARFVRRRQGGRLSVFNPLPYPREEVIELPPSRGKGESILRVKVPPASVVPLFSCAVASSTRDHLTARPDSLENRLLCADFAADGTIRRLLDKQTGITFSPFDSCPDAPGMLNFFRQPDGGDLWSHYCRPANGSLLYTAPQRDPMPPSSVELLRRGGVASKALDAEAMELPVIRLVESGPERATLEIARRTPRLVTRVSLCAGEKMLRFSTRLTPYGRHHRWRVAFPTGVPRGRIRFSIPCGFLTRPEGEYAAQGWVDYADQRKGLCLLNRGLPGANVTGGIMMLSLFRAVAMDSMDRRPWYEEGVEHHFEFALAPFDPRDPDYNPERLAARFNQPLRLLTAPAGCAAPDVPSLLSLDGKGAELMGLRQLGSDVELRLHESRGVRCQVTLATARDLIRCTRTDFRGAPFPDQRLTFSGHEIRLQLRPFEIANLRLSLH